MGRWSDGRGTVRDGVQGDSTLPPPRLPLLPFQGTESEQQRTTRGGYGYHTSTTSRRSFPV